MYEMCAFYSNLNDSVKRALGATDATIFLLSVCVRIQSTTSHMTSLVCVYFANTVTLVVDYIAIFVHAHSHSLSHTHARTHTHIHANIQNSLIFIITSSSISVFIHIMNMRACGRAGVQCTLYIRKFERIQINIYERLGTKNQSERPIRKHVSEN